MHFTSRNPSTHEVLETWKGHNVSQVEEALDRAEQAQRAWRGLALEDRAQVLRDIAHQLRQRSPALARRMTQEVGKPIAQSRGEVEKCAWVCDYYADQAAQMLQPEPVELDEGTRGEVVFEPLGVILAIMPWNFPLWQVLRCAAPALMAGNVVVLKHAPNVFGCAQDIEELMLDAGLPQGCFTQLRVETEAVESIIAHPAVRGVALTGSTRAGRAVAKLAGAALKPVVLELGGSDPAIVLEDADLDLAVRECTTSRMLNNGQSCIAAKRFLVEGSIYQEFLARLQQALDPYTMGDPMEEATQLGPMARQDLRDELHRQVTQSVRAGARCLRGGQLPEQPGAWYPATLLVDVPPQAPAYREELFGPVAAVIKVRDAQHAIEVANDTAYGLGASVFTQDKARGRRMLRQLQAGACFLNAFVRSDPRLPFGGIKDSGHGRELGRYGLLAFVNIKTLYERL